MKAFRLPGENPDSAAAGVLWDSGCLGVVEVPETAGRSGALVAYFAEEIDLGLPGAWEDVPDVDHLAAYRESLAPVRVGRLVVAPSHREVPARDGDLIVWLDPGSAFGTGHHETTRLALAALERLSLAGRSVLDVGSGSGLLAIAADRLGAESALGVDVDPATLPVARANAARNSSRARFALGSLGATGLPERFDVIVANLYAELHAELLSEYARRLVPGGVALLTGVLVEREGIVTASVPAELAPCGRERDGDWLLLAYRRAS